MLHRIDNTTSSLPAEEVQELRRLLSGVAAGSQDDLAELYRRTRTAVYGLALSYLRNAHDAQDLTQDVFVHIWDTAGQYRPTGSPVGWILAVCRNLCLMHLRRESRQVTMEDQEWHAIPDNCPGLDSQERLLLQDALAVLGADCPAAHGGPEAPGNRSGAGPAPGNCPVKISQSIEKDASLHGRR